MDKLSALTKNSSLWALLSLYYLDTSMVNTYNVRATDMLHTQAKYGDTQAKKNGDYNLLVLLYS